MPLYRPYTLYKQPNWRVQPQHYQGCVRTCVQKGRMRTGYCEQHCMPHIDAVTPLPKPTVPRFEYRIKYLQSFPMATNLYPPFLDQGNWPNENFGPQ